MRVQPLATALRHVLIEHERQRAADVSIGASPQTVTAASAGPGFAYVEIEPLTAPGQPPPKYSITLPR